MPASGTTVHCTSGQRRTLLLRRRVALVAVGLVALAACASESTPPEAPPAGAVSDLRASEAVRLDEERIAADAIDQAELSSLLGDAGFESAVERRYAGPGGEIRRVEVRVVRFGTSDGAERYLAWVVDHVEELIGEAAPATSTPGMPTSVYVHVPGGCCPKETVLALSAWRDGRDVLRVLVAGPGADGAAGIDLIASIRQRMSAS